jgi:hypothetical protein
MMHNQEEHTDKHTATPSLLSQSKTWQSISGLLSSGSKLTALARSESVKEHGKESRPGVRTVLIGDIIIAHVEVVLSQMEGESVQGIGLPK